MAGKVAKAELLKSIDAYLAACVAGGYRLGLFKNDLTVTADTLIADIVPCDFGGYSGLIDLPAFGSAVWTAPRAIATAPDVQWEADGTSTNNVYGVYGVDGAGELAWIMKRTDGLGNADPVGIGAAGQRYTHTPTYSRRSEF